MFAADWRLKKFPMSGRYPAVTRLHVHLPAQNDVYFRTAAELRRKILGGIAERSTLTEFFRLNRNNYIMKNGRSVRSLRYQDITEFFWFNKAHYLEERVNRTASVARIYFAGIGQGDRYYLRLLLMHVRGPTSFDHLRTVDGVTYESYREAANQLGLTLNDQHYAATLSEQATALTGHQLRVLFAIMVKHSDPSDPAKLWHDFAEHLSDDCRHAIASVDPDYVPTREIILNLGLARLYSVLADHNVHSPHTFLPRVRQDLLRGFETLTKYQEHEEPMLADYWMNFAGARQTMNEDQLAILTAVIAAIEIPQQRMFFLDGPGGTGKTFVLNALLNYCASCQIPFVAAASSGIASLLLLRGTTSHSAFKIPLSVNTTSTCSFTKQDATGRTLQSAKFIVWDEIAMQHRDAIQCVDRSLRDLRGDNRPFGGATMLFSGDFRQTLPVIPRGTLADQVAATIKYIPWWPTLHQFRLTQNVRLNGPAVTPASNSTHSGAFAAWLLALGSGTLQNSDSEEIPIEFVKVVRIPEKNVFDENLAEQTYRELNNYVSTSQLWNLVEYFSGRCILTPLVRTVARINSFLISRLSSHGITSFSIDTNAEDDHHPLTPEILNSFLPSNFPEHLIEIKVGMPVILLRNLSLPEGLANGTRMVVVAVARNSLRCRIINGPRKNSLAVIPRINLLHRGNAQFPVPFYRFQFPIASAFAMTINKSQSQSLNFVTIFLPSPVFSHGQLYVALSRCTSADNATLCISRHDDQPRTTNVVCREVLA